jgi:hypothetical protein
MIDVRYNVAASQINGSMTCLTATGEQFMEIERRRFTGRDIDHQKGSPK